MGLILTLLLWGYIGCRSAAEKVGQYVAATNADPLGSLPTHKKKYPPYDGRLERYVEQVFEGRRCKPNEIYFSSFCQIHFYVDLGGYIHELEIGSDVIDYIVRLNGIKEEVSRYGSIEECKQKIEGSNV